MYFYSSLPLWRAGMSPELSNSDPEGNDLQGDPEVVECAQFA